MRTPVRQAISTNMEAMMMKYSMMLTVKITGLIFG
jgi:hypothetical protein